MAYIVASETGFPGEALAAYDQSIPAGHQSGDILLAIITQDGGGTTIAVSGWTQIGSQAAAQGQRTTAFWKLASSSAEADFSATGATDEWIVTIIVIRNANTTTPIHLENRTDSTASTFNFLDSGTVTTTEANCLIIHAFGFDGVFKLIPNDPSSMVMLGRDTDFVGCTQIVGYTNKLTTGATDVVKALSEVQSEGGTALVIAISDAAPASAKMSPVATETYTVLKRYGGITSAATTVAAFIRHDAITFDVATTLAMASIAGITIIAVATPAQVAFQDPIRPWGSMTGLSMTGSALDNTGRWVGYTHAISSTNMANKIFSLEFMMSTVSTALFGSKGCIVVFQDSSGNWAAFTLSIRAGLVAGVCFTFQVDLANATKLDSGGSINWADITRIGYLFHKRTTATTVGILRIKNALLLERTTIVDGCAETPATPALTNRLLDGWGPVGVGSLQGGGQALFRSGVRYGNGSRKTYLSTSATSYELPLRATSALAKRFWQVPDQSPGAKFDLYANAADTVDMTACVMASDTYQEWVINASSSSSASYDFTGASLIGWKITHNVSGITINKATIKNCTVLLNGGALNGCVIAKQYSSPAITTNNPQNIANCAFTSPGTGHAIQISAAGTFAFSGNTFSGYAVVDGSTGNECIYNNSGGLVTLNIPAGGATPTIRNGGGASTVIVFPPVSIDVPDALEDSRIQIYNVTQAAEIDNDVVGAAGYSYTITTEADDGDTIRLRLTILGDEPIEQIGVFSDTAGLTYLVSQEEDTIITAIGIDGSTVTEFEADYVNNHIDIDDTETTKARFAAWWFYNLTTENGIKNWYGGLFLEDEANYKFIVTAVDVQFNNINVPPVRFTDNNRRLYRDDAGVMIDTGSGSIQFDSGKVYVSVVAVGGVAPTAEEMRSAVGLASANLDTQLGDLPTDTENATAVWGAMGALGKSYALMMAEINACQVIRVGPCQGATSNTITLDASASSLDNFYNRATLTVVTGSAAGQNRLINDYDGSTKIATLDRAFLITPSASDFFAIDSRGNVRSASDIMIGKAQGGTSSTIILESGSSTINDFYNRLFILIESGTGQGQARLISDYDGGTLTVTVGREWITTPDSTSTYVLLPFGSVKVSEIDDGVDVLTTEQNTQLMKTLTVGKFMGL